MLGVASQEAGGELHGFLTDAEPYAVRIGLAPVFTRLRAGHPQ